MQAVEPTEKQTQSNQTTKDRFNALDFSKTAGYVHYHASDLEDTVRRDESIDRFLESDSLEEPVVEPTKHSWETIRRTITEYEEIIDTLLLKSFRTPRDEAELDLLIQKSGELFRYEELMLAMGAASLDARDSHRRIASDLSIEIIGGVNQGAFKQLVNDMVALAESSDSLAGKELLGMVQSQERGTEVFVSYDLEPKTREIIMQDIRELYPGIDDLYNQDGGDGPVSPEGLVELCNQLFKIADFDPEWAGELADGKSARTASGRKRVLVGRDRAALPDRKSAVGLAFHEAIVHGSRSRGEKLPGSGNFEEGLATRLQQIISGEERTPGTQYYLSIGLQAGLDRGGAPRSYREAFEILWRREVLLAKKAGKAFDIAKSRSDAQRQVHRTRRGGAIDTRDSSYFVGAQSAAIWLNEIAKLPQEERRKKLQGVLADQYDPTILEHVAFIESAR